MDLFSKTDEIMENFKAKGLIEAKEKLDLLRMSKEERVIYESYLEDLHLKASLADTQKFKLDKAKKDGLQEKSEQVVINGHKKGLSNDFLSELTSLSIQEVEEILKNVPSQENKK
jgi:hypothetical protein